MKELALEKQLLIAESELNRTQLRAAMVALTPGTRRFTDRTISVGMIASSAVMLMREVADSRRRRIKSGTPKTSTMQTVVKIGSMVSTLWLAFFPQEQNKKTK